MFDHIFFQFGNGINKTKKFIALEFKENISCQHNFHPIASTLAHLMHNVWLAIFLKKLK
jgi:hypothetical protein